MHAVTDYMKKLDAQLKSTAPDRVPDFHRGTSAFVKDVFEVKIPRPRNGRSKEYYDLVDKISKQIE